MIISCRVTARCCVVFLTSEVSALRLGMCGGTGRSLSKCPSAETTGSKTLPGGWTASLLECCLLWTLWCCFFLLSLKPPYCFSSFQSCISLLVTVCYFFFSEYRRKKKLRSVLHLCEYIYLRTCSYLKGGSLNEIAIQKIWFRKRYIPAHKFYLFIKRDHQRFLINGVALSELSGVGSRRRLQLSGFSGTSWNWFCASTENVMTTIIQFWEEQESNSRWRWLGTW